VISVGCWWKNRKRQLRRIMIKYILFQIEGYQRRWKWYFLTRRRNGIVVRTNGKNLNILLFIITIVNHLISNSIPTQVNLLHTSQILER